MKTQNEQLNFANRLKELTEHHGDLIAKLATSDNKLEILLEIKATLVQMNDLRNSYIEVSL